MKLIKQVTIFLLVSLFAGCATLMPEPESGLPIGEVQAIHAFSLSGRFSVRADGKSNSGKLYWQSSLARDDLTLANPLGQGVAKLERDSAGVRLTTSDRQFSAPDAETLTQDTLGWRLPLSGLHDWVLGRPANGVVEAQERDTTGRLTLLVQQGWHIEYGDYGEAGQGKLPTRLRLTRPELGEAFEIRLIVDRWEPVQ